MICKIFVGHGKYVNSKKITNNACMALKDAIEKQVFYSYHIITFGVFYIKNK